MKTLLHTIRGAGLGYAVRGWGIFLRHQGDRTFGLKQPIGLIIFSFDDYEARRGAVNS